MSTTNKKKTTFLPAETAGTFKPNVSQAAQTVKSGVSDFVSGVKETAQKVGEAVPGVTSLGQSLKSYANMNNYAADQKAAQERLDLLDANEPGKYAESQELINLKGQLSEVESKQPAAYENKYQQQIDALLGKMTEQDKFSYDFSTDSNWLTMQEQAKRNALLAMENAMGEAAGLTGGYASSAAQMVGQQAYQQEMSEVTDIIPQLADNALNRWQANNSQMASNLAALQSQQEADYSRYYNDWQLWNQNRSYMYQKVQDMSDDEFSKYLYDLQRWQADRSYYAEQKQMAVQNQQWQQELNESRRQFNNQMAFNYINMGVDAALDLTKTGIDAGISLAGIGADAALGAAELKAQKEYQNNSLAYDYAALEKQDEWNQADYELALAQLAEEKRQFNEDSGYKYAALKQDKKQYKAGLELDYAKLDETKRQFDLENGIGITEEEEETNVPIFEVDATGSKVSANDFVNTVDNLSRLSDAQKKANAEEWYENEIINDAQYNYIKNKFNLYG